MHNETVKRLKMAIEAIQLKTNELAAMTLEYKKSIPCLNEDIRSMKVFQIIFDQISNQYNNVIDLTKQIETNCDEMTVKYNTDDNLQFADDESEAPEFKVEYYPDKVTIDNPQPKHRYKDAGNSKQAVPGYRDIAGREYDIDGVYTLLAQAKGYIVEQIDRVSETSRNDVCVVEVDKPPESIGTRKRLPNNIFNLIRIDDNNVFNRAKVAEDNRTEAVEMLYKRNADIVKAYSNGHEGNNKISDKDMDNDRCSNKTARRHSQGRNVGTLYETLVYKQTSSEKRSRGWYPDIENGLREWVLKFDPATRLRLNKFHMLAKAKEIGKSNKRFKGTDIWVTNFLKRNLDIFRPQ